LNDSTIIRTIKTHQSQNTKERAKSRTQNLIEIYKQESIKIPKNKATKKTAHNYRYEEYNNGQLMKSPRNNREKVATVDSRNGVTQRNAK